MSELGLDLEAEFGLPSGHVSAIEIVVVFVMEDGWPCPDSIEDNLLTFEELFSLSNKYHVDPWFSLSDMMSWLSDQYLKKVDSEAYEENHNEKQELHDWEP